jgi:hypothetical protein
LELSCDDVLEYLEYGSEQEVTESVVLRDVEQVQEQILLDDHVVDVEFEPNESGRRLFQELDEGQEVRAQRHSLVFVRLLEEVKPGFDCLDCDFLNDDGEKVKQLALLDVLEHLLVVLLGIARLLAIVERTRVLVHQLVVFEQIYVYSLFKPFMLLVAFDQLNHEQVHKTK